MGGVQPRLTKSSFVRQRRTIYQKACPCSAWGSLLDSYGCEHMGIEDRDYYRGDTPSGVYTGSHSMVTKIMVVTVAVYLADVFIAGRDHWLMKGMASSANDLFPPWYWWRFLTSGFAHAEDIKHILFNMLGLFFLGRSVEMKLGQKEFLTFYLVAIVLGSVGQALRVFLTVDPNQWVGCYGASGAVTAVVILFILYYPKQMLLVFFVIPAPAWVVGILIIAINVFGASGYGDPRVAHDVHLFGAVFAAAYFYFRWNLSRFVPNSLSLRALKPKPKLRVHDPDADYQVRDSEADELLEKVNREGMDSLTAREKKILEDYSRRMRQKHR